jgi:hypothetical protein
MDVGDVEGISGICWNIAWKYQWIFENMGKDGMMYQEYQSISRVSRYFETSL